MKTESNVWEGCVLLLLTMCVAVVSYFALAFVVGQMWDWYVAPVFGIARPSYPLLVGLSVLIAYITNSKSSSNTLGIKKEKVEPWVAFMVLFYDALVAPFIILFVGWIVQFFVKG